MATKSTTDKLRSLAEKARDKEVANILKKLNDGKTLNAAERKTLDSYNSRKITQKEFAKEFGITQQAVSHLVRQGMPTDSIESARKWRERYLELSKKGRITEDYNTARTRKVIAETIRIENKIAREKGEQIELKAAMEVWSTKLKRLADTIKGLEGLTNEQKSRLCLQLRQDLDRLPDELAGCKFDEAEEEPTADEEADEQE